MIEGEIRRPRTSQLSVLECLRGRELGGSSGWLSGVLARSLQLQFRWSQPVPACSLHRHPCHGLLIASAHRLLFFRHGEDVPHCARQSSVQSITFVMARWAPVSAPLVGVVMSDNLQKMHCVEVLRPPIHIDDATDSSDRAVLVSLQSVPVLRVNRRVLNISWSAERDDENIQLFVCVEDTLYIVYWPSTQVRRFRKYASPVVCFSPSAPGQHSSQLCSPGLVGLRNGAISTTDSRIRGINANILINMKHCVDHIHVMKNGTSVLLQDVVGNVNVFDIRRTNVPSLTVVRKHPSRCAQLIQGSLFWVTTDEKMILVRADINDVKNTIDVWSLVDEQTRLAQVCESHTRGVSPGASILISPNLSFYNDNLFDFTSVSINSKFYDVTCP